jgi:hypothetical protein
MTLLWGIASLLLLLTFIAILGVLVYEMLAPVFALRAARRKAQRHRSARQWALHDLDHSEIKRRLLNHVYFSPSLRATPTLQDFFLRLDNGEEVWLASRYPRKKLYRLLVKAEHEAGMKGPPQALEHVDEILELLEQLARRSKEVAA